MQHFMRHSESFLILTSVFKFLTAACSRYRLVTFRIWRRKYLTYCDKYLSYFLLNVHIYNIKYRCVLPQIAKQAGIYVKKDKYHRVRLRLDF